jgi:hypothetical protein
MRLSLRPLSQTPGYATGRCDNAASADRTVCDRLLISHARREPEDVPAGHHQIVRRRAILVESGSHSVRVPTVKFDSQLLVGISQIDAVTTSSDPDPMLLSELRPAGRQ